jgi:hypothetical protein
MFTLSNARNFAVQFSIASAAMLASVVFASAQVCNPTPPSPYTATAETVVCSNGTYNGKIGALEAAGLGSPTTPPLSADQTLYSNSNVTVNAGSVINAGTSSAISLYNTATINIYGTVQNSAVNASTGAYNTGGNTVEVNAGSLIHVFSGGKITADGSQGSAEAINFQGYAAQSNIYGRNTLIIDADGVVQSTANAKALWNQNGAALTIDNSGILASQNRNENNQIVVLGGNNTGGVNFYNRQGAATYG